MKEINEIARGLEEAIRNIPFPTQPANLYEPIEYTLASGGKRLRPTLLLATAAAFGADWKEMIPQACGLEIFHNFTLLHDDVMDNADVRRGRPTVHRKWDDNTAILSGDAMLTLAVRTVAKCPADKLPEVLGLFNRTAMEIYEGQQYDMDFEKRGDVTVGEYIDMIRLKTSVLLACACRMGAYMAGADENDCKIMYDFGIALGLAFQLQDDFLDTFGNPEVFGKQIGGDILNDKKTWLLINACARDKSGVLASALAGEYAPEEKIAKVREVYVALGLDREIRDVINDYARKAVECIEMTSMNTEWKTYFTDLAGSLTSREV